MDQEWSHMICHLTLSLLHSPLFVGSVYSGAFGGWPLSLRSLCFCFQVSSWSCLLRPKGASLPLSCLLTLFAFLNMVANVLSFLHSSWFSLMLSFFVIWFSLLKKHILCFYPFTGNYPYLMYQDFFIQPCRHLWFGSDFEFFGLLVYGNDRHLYFLHVHVPL